MKSQRQIYYNVASCALKRWAALAGKTNLDDRKKAEEEKRTFFMALSLARKAR